MEGPSYFSKAKSCKRASVYLSTNKKKGKKNPPRNLAMKIS